MSFFKYENKQRLLFTELPPSAQKAIVWRWAIECENPLGEKIEHLLADAPEQPFDLSEDVWLKINAIGGKHFGSAKFIYFELPTETVKNVVLTQHNDIKDDYTNWAEYKESYGTKDVPLHSMVNRLPCLAPIGDDEIFEDGWHRLHSYINQGHTTIPVLEY